MGCSCSILVALMEFMAMPAILYSMFFLGIEYFSLALGVTSTSWVVVPQFYIHNLIPSEEQVVEWVMVLQGRTEGGGGGGGGKEKAMASSSIANLSSMSNREAAPPNYVPYPPALAKYEDVVISPKLFLDTLEKLHANMGTKFMIPIIGGKDLDLHRLFVEVTSRGGFEKVIRERRWKEVTSVFSFPSTATNASFVLRKYYMSLLHHYEQIYFLKAKGWSPSVDPSRIVSSPVSSQRLAEPGVQSPEIKAAAVHPQRRIHTAEVSPGATSAPLAGSPVVGVIDGKFDGGYLCTVKVGSTTLRGVLYISPEDLAHQAPKIHSVLQHQSVSTSNNENTPAASGIPRRRRRKKSEIKKRDPNHPKTNRSGYNFFFAEQHARLKPLHPGKDRDISRMIGELWNKLEEPEKVVYQDKAVKDKERYRKEMEEYRKRLKVGPVISDAVPLQQRRLESDINMAEASEKIGTENRESPETPENEIGSGKDDKSDSDDKTADKGSDSEKSPPVVDIGAENVGMEKSGKRDEVGDESLESSRDITMAEESNKESVPEEEKLSMSCEGKEPLPLNGQRDQAKASGDGDEGD